MTIYDAAMRIKREAVPARENLRQGVKNCMATGS